MKNEVAAYVCAAVSLGLIGSAVWKSIRTILFLRLARTAIGQVVGFQTMRNSDRQMMYLPVIEFAPASDSTKHKIRITSTVASNPPAHRVGDAVTVRYLPKNPRAGRISSFWTMWALPLIFFAAGLLLVWLAYSIYND